MHWLQANKRPMMSHLRESGSIEQDADIIIFLYRDDYYKTADGDTVASDAEQNVAEIIVAKNRHGSTDTVKVGWYPFNSAYLTTVYRGMRSKKFIIRSAPSGVGKSRSCMADALNIASSHMYDWNKHEWVFIGEPMNVLYISTELTKEEIQDCLLAHITGIAQDRLEEWKDIGEEELKVIERGIKLMQECKLYCEYTSDFTIDSINELIESHVINNNITHCFFDYINDSPSLYSYFYEKTKTRLRTDQVLFMFSEQLKLT